MIGYMVKIVVRYEERVDLKGMVKIGIRHGARIRKVQFILELGMGRECI